ncbi:MAG: hydrogenase maturation protease [Candidatus Bathyarchaeia archaeon]
MSLEESLCEFFVEGERRVVVVGIGSEIRGDEAAGQLIVEDLKTRKPAGTLLIDAGTRPENFTGDIRKFTPTHILMVEAARFDGAPGEGRLIPHKSLEMRISLITPQLPSSKTIWRRPFAVMSLFWVYSTRT